jgi:signal transduction histidine kinase
MRLRLILSHTIPILIIVPLMGVFLAYAMERILLIPRLTREISSDLDIISKIAYHDPSIWQSSSQAQSFVEEYGMQAPWRLMLLDPQGVILASNSPSDTDRLGTKLDADEIATVLQGNTILNTDFSSMLSSEIVDAWAAIQSPSGQTLGIVRVSGTIEAVIGDLIRMRNTVILVLLGSLGLGVLIGLGLAINLERPLRNITLSFNEMTGQQEPTLIKVEGPEEMQVLARAFNQLVDRLHSMETTRKQLLANLVHEFGRPLGAVRSAIHALSKGAFQDDELRTDLLSGMDMEIRRLDQVVQDLTQLYEKSAGLLEIKRQRTDLNSWLRETLRPWQARAEENDLHWVTIIGPLPFLWIDQVRLGQVIGNLLSNAIKFTPAGGEVRVRAEVESDEVYIHIEDTGPGLTQEDQEHLFLPFYRGNRGSRFTQGMGLGLLIARDLILAHEGSIEVTSTLGEGSRFSIRLPLALEKNAHAEASDKQS